MEPPIGGGSAEQVHLIHTGVFFVLVLNVFAYRLFVSTDGRDEISRRPEMLARQIALTLAVGPRQMDRARALDHGLFACSASDRVWTLMNSACGSMISWTSLGGVSCRARGRTPAPVTSRPWGRSLARPRTSSVRH